jgi:hypothetical protein
MFEGRDLGFPATTLPRALQVCEWVEGIRGGGGGGGGGCVGASRSAKP